MGGFKIKVILAIPNFRWIKSDKNTLWHYIPYNLCMLAAMVKGLCEVKIIDANQYDLSVEDFSEEVRKFAPDVFGVSVMMDEYGQTGHIAARVVKESTPNATVVFGGVYATTNVYSVIADENIDYVVIGEGEYVFRELIEFFMERAELPERGIAFKVKGQIVNWGIADRIKDLDSLPFPAYELINFMDYAKSARRKSVDSPRAYPYARILTSRGCPFNCVFCQVNKIMGQEFRGRSPANVLNEIEHLKQKYKIKSLIFDDDNMLYDRDRAMQIFKGMIDWGLYMPWVMIATAAFKLDQDLLVAMKESGCEYIDVAIESGTQRILKKIINKPLDLEYAKWMIDISKGIGIYVSANFVIGFPTETWQEIRNTIRYAEYINADYTKIFSVIPLRHTRLWDICKKGGYFKKGFDPKKTKWSTGQIETDEFTPDALTILRAFEWDRINFSSDEKAEKTRRMMGVTDSELKKIRKDTIANAVGLIRKGAG